ncbi:MAG TPA: amidase [Bryobacteraceae bacterium]|nr:amidase [Bryobacteraceae bacterium]
MTIVEAAAALRSRQVSCLELTNRCLDQIAKLNPRLNAFLTVTEEAARKRASELDRDLAHGIDHGPLHGIPIAHKDLVWTRGVRTTSGSKLFADFVPASDAAVVEKLNRAGAVMLGKTGLHEIAYGVTSENPHFGVIRNPRDLERSPGGSSGGSGAAVAASMAFMATGTDTGGSIRIPASFCGVVGLKPTYGAVDRAGIQPLGFSLDHVGPLTRTAADASLTFHAMAEPRHVRPAPPGIQNLRIGLPENFYLSSLDPEVKQAVENAARIAEQLGARVSSVRVPDIDALNAAGRVILLAEASALYEPYWNRRDDFGADVLALLDQGRLVPATDYVNAQRLRRSVLKDFHALFASIDCLFTPTTPITAPLIGQKQVELDSQMVDTRLATTRLVRGINVLGFPALSLPCATSAGGLPIGLQMIARPWEEALLLTLGQALEPQLPPQRPM